MAHSADVERPSAAAPALDSVACSRRSASRPAASTSACAAGLAALAAQLDGAFTGADGAGIDLTLSGSAPLIDKFNHGVADRLGVENGSSPDALATWSVQLRTSAGNVQLAASFEGIRN